MNTYELTANDPGVAGPVSTWRDSLGIVASVGCAIHCAAMPFVFAYLPALGLSFLADEAFHKWMALICFLIAIVAFIPGLRRHGSWVPVSIGAAGLAAITFAAFGLAGDCCPSCSSKSTEEPSQAAVACTDPGCDQCGDVAAESMDVAGNPEIARVQGSGKDLLSFIAPWITPFGGVLLVSAHLMNRRYGCLCGCCGEKPEATC